MFDKVSITHLSEKCKHLFLFFCKIFILSEDKKDSLYP